jgi:putative transposase
MKTNTPSYRGYRFPSDIISHAVWLYHRFCLSFRDVEDLLAEGGVIVSYETIRQWCRKFGTDYAGNSGGDRVAWATRGTWTNCS